MVGHEALGTLALVLVALLASTLSGVTGFGGAVLLLPALAAVYGVRDAVAVLTVTQVAGNGSRALFGRHEIDWAVAWRFMGGAIPAAVLGSLTFAALPGRPLSALLGGFLLLTVLYRHSPAPKAHMPLSGFVPLGLVFGFLSAVLGSVGPFVAPPFLAYGLVKSAYVSTEAVGALAMHLTKSAAYGKLNLLGGAALLRGLALSPATILGSYAGRHLAGRLPERTFRVLIEMVLIVAGSRFVLDALR